MLLRIVFVVLFLSLATKIAAQSPSADEFAGTPEQKELIELIESLYRKYDALYAEMEKLTDLKQRFRYFDDHDPAQEIAGQLLAFEQRNAQTEVGLMALRRLNLIIDNRSSPNNPLHQTRREALQRLLGYADSPVLPEILRYLDSGLYDSTTDRLLRALAADANADPTNREFARLMTAESMLAACDYYELIERRTREITAGEPELWAGEKDEHANMKTRFPDLIQIQAWQTEALEILSSIANSATEHRQPALSNVDPKWHIIRFDAEETKKMPLLSAMAEGLLFKESHLKRGKPAPDLNLNLVSGDPWSLAKQHGKVVVIQFSFKGCGPCEAMYPELRELQSKHKDRLAVLSIMADQNKNDTDQAVEEGKLTWNVHYDGWRGPVATRWAVRGFPTVYVIDRQGRIAETTRRDLSKKVADLLHE